MKLANVNISVSEFNFKLNIYYNIVFSSKCDDIVVSNKHDLYKALGMNIA